MAALEKAVRSSDEASIAIGRNQRRLPKHGLGMNGGFEVPNDSNVKVKHDYLASYFAKNPRTVMKLNRYSRKLRMAPPMCFCHHSRITLPCEIRVFETHSEMQGKQKLALSPIPRWFSGTLRLLQADWRKFYLSVTPGQDPI